MKAMILAAGFGTRLAPHSLVLPKPLFPILNRPLLAITIEQLRQAGVDEIIVNAHHLAGQIQAALSGLAGVTVLQEDAILGTGGGLRNALPILGRQPVLVVNADIAHTLDLSSLAARHLASGAAVSMVLQDQDRFRVVAVDEADRVLAFGPAAEGARRLAYTGVQFLWPEILDAMPAGVHAELIPWYQAAIARGVPIQGLVAAGHFWTDIGTPVDYLDLHARLLTGRLSAPHLPRPGGSPHLGPGCQLASGVTVADWACLGAGVTVGAGASLARVVVWAGVAIAAGAQLADAIVSG
ncbi:MAG: NDP-sugar synthase [Thermodesulfobacteriota bacterium]